jgi:hypothetical protein
MDLEPIIPFGKYKGQPITTLLKDTNYLEWCKQQEWFKKFPIVYNICVNQTIVNQNENSKTPEHNKIQNLFLEEENQNRLIDLLFNPKSIINKIQNGLIHKDFNKYFEKYEGDMSFNQLFTIYKIEFETTYNWDVFLKIQGLYFNIIYKKEYWRKEWNILEKYFTDIFNIKKCEVSSYSDGKIDASLNYNSYIYIEIKPILGDDYPNVLRKMKQQKNLTSCDKDNMLCKKLYILLVKDFASSTTTKEQLIEIFQQSNIKVIFLKDITEDDVKLVETNKDNISELKEYIIKLEEENMMLKETLKQYETPTS